MPLPEDFPTLRLAMPQEAIAPDFFHYDGYRIVSRRLRDAVAQPEDVVQFIPIELVSGSPRARAQHYQLMHLLARQPAMDLDRSECTLEDFTDRITGQPRKRAVFIDRFVLLDNLQPRTEIF
ncbi:MAG: hypothetical protein JO264_01580, partial [Acidisphaera sp.]|nr:hypothetical protein [Acidisphaera sp.]